MAVNEQDIAILATSTLFSGADKLDWSAIPELKVLEPEVGDVLIEPGRSNACIFVVLAGSFHVYLNDTSEQPIAELLPGALAGELSVIDDKPPSAYVLAAVSSRVLVLTREQLWQMMAQDYKLSFNLLGVLAQRVRSNNELILQGLELQRVYRQKAETDALTGLHNRGWMDDIFPRQLDLSGRIGQPVSLLLIDIDNFKRINDVYGHQVGDVALRHVAKVVHDNLRNADLSARYGGEEFVVLLLATGQEPAVHSAERLCRKVAAFPLDLADGQMLHMTVSIGVAQWRSGSTLEALIGLADRALYLAKRSGRNQVRSAAQLAVQAAS